MKNVDQLDGLLTVHQCAQLLQVSPQTIWLMVDEGLEHVVLRTGPGGRRTIRISRTVLAEFVSTRRQTKLKDTQRYRRVRIGVMQDAAR